MFRYFAENITFVLIKNKILNIKNRNIYVYAIEVILLNVILLLSLLGISILGKEVFYEENNFRISIIIMYYGKCSSCFSVNSKY